MVKNICDLSKEINSELVITSSWRNGFKSSFHDDNLPQIKALELEMKLYDCIISYATPIFKSKSRDFEIERFLYYHPCQRYVIIDDDKNEYVNVSNRNLFVDSSVGFSSIYFKKAKDILKDEINIDININKIDYEYS